MKLIGDYAPSAVKDNDIKNYFGEEHFSVSVGSGAPWGVNVDLHGHCGTPSY